MNNQRDRALYEKAKGAFPGSTPTVSYLREEVALVNNNGTYRFNFADLGRDNRPTERKLTIKDAFVANTLWLFLLVERDSKPGSGVLMTYPNPVEVAKAGAVSHEDLEAVYNGSLRAQVDQEILFDGIDTRRFRSVRPTQLSAVNDKDQQDYHDGALLVEPNLILVGSRKNEFTLQLPAFTEAAAMAAVTNGWSVRVVLVAGGYYIPGGAGLKK